MKSGTPESNSGKTRFKKMKRAGESWTALRDSKGGSAEHRRRLSIEMQEAEDAKEKEQGDEA